MPLEFPPIYLLPTRLELTVLHELEGSIPSLTYDVNEAEVVVGNISKPDRALFELRHLKVNTEPASIASAAGPPPSKRRKLSPSADPGAPDGRSTDQPRTAAESETIKVVKLSWLTESLRRGAVLPLPDYIVYEGRRIGAPARSAQADSWIMSRALEDTSQPNQAGTPGHRRSKFKAREPTKHMPAMVRHSTSEQKAAEELPPVPAFLQTTYSCQRSTPTKPLNDSFVTELKSIRTARLLIGDKIGVRAYSTSIATLSAYPYKVGSATEVARLPGCGAKIAELYQEWSDAGKLREVEDANANPELTVLRLFYDIWGVGDATAREFYRRGWRDLDDLVEYAWDDHLSRVQQIGVKYYDDFKLKIPRPEVEAIGSTILAHARAFNPDFQMAIVGGYRRGKAESGDVDVIISHPNESKTHNLIEKLVSSLERGALITHTLILSNKNSERGQTPVSWKGNAAAGSGFDTLDKALVVWKQPRADGTSVEPPHRRVDIIISPWKTVGCAVLGWSGETTFQRDLRRYCKKEMGLKFDSSGIRSRVDGTWMDLEGGAQGQAPDMATAEKRVFCGLGLEWRSPGERCTG